MPIWRVGTRGNGSALVALLGTLFFISSLPRPCSAATPAEIDGAIKKGIDYLYTQLDENGNWDHILKPNAEGKWSGNTKQVGGPTSLAVYALLTAGESQKEPRIAKALIFLQTVQPQGTYSVGFHANAFALLQETTETKLNIYRDAQWIHDALRFSKDPKVKGFYGYGAGNKTGLDRSTSQIAELGAWACAQTGHDLGADYWKVVEDAWRKAQAGDGSWNYSDSYNSSPSIAMTASGVATLFVTQEYLHATEFSDCNGSVNDPHIELGLKWLGDSYTSVFSYKYPYYALYSLERAASASGYRYFGTHDWYKEGTDWIVKQQHSDGSWAGGTSGVPDTSFALLFLARGRSPVAVNKLQYAVDDVANDQKGANWNQRPRDIANVCRWAGRQQERTLNWQIVNFAQPVEELENAPIVYISGNQAIAFKDEEVAKLREFVEDGGLIVGNADCGNKMFTTSFQKLGQKLFPSYEFRVLPLDHVVFTGEQFLAKAWKKQPNVLGVSNGSRELMLLFSSDDPARYWQMHTHSKGHEELHEVMADIFSYAVERENVQKGETFMIRPIADVQTNRAMKIARLQYPGNWNPEPGGWRRVAALLRNQDKIDATVEPVELGTGKLDNTYAIAALTGTAAYKMTPAAKQEMKKYVEGGGTLLVDSCGGSPAFSVDASACLCELFAAKQPALPVLPPAHALYTSDFPGAPKIADVEYRAFARTSVGQALKTGRVRGVDIKGRPAVYFSPEDLSTGLVGHPVDGVIGYAPDSATQIVRHIVLLCAPAPTTKPATP